MAQAERAILAASCETDPDHLRAELRTAQPEDAAALFWIAFAWGNLVAQRPISPESLSDLANTEILMRRVVELADTLEQAGAHTYLGALYGRLPAFLGGNQRQAAYHLDRALHITGGNYLPVRLEQAEFKLRVTGDSVAYDQALTVIAGADDGLLPASALDNAVARCKADLRARAGGDHALLFDSSSVTGCTATP